MVKLTFGLGVLIIIIGVGFLIGGFLRYTDTVTSYEAAMPTDKADAIVVFTGGSMRIEKAVKLLQDGFGARLLISGVNPATSRSSLIKRASIQPQLFDCCIDIDIRATDTKGNAVEAEKWVANHGYESLLVVTSTYHMPRSLLETRRRLPTIKLIPHAVDNDVIDRANWYRDRKSLRHLVYEYSKYVIAQAGPVLSDRPFTAVRATMSGQ